MLKRAVLDADRVIYNRSANFEGQLPDHFISDGPRPAKEPRGPGAGDCVASASPLTLRWLEPCGVQVGSSRGGLWPAPLMTTSLFGRIPCQFASCLLSWLWLCA